MPRKSKLSRSWRAASAFSNFQACLNSESSSLAAGAGREAIRPWLETAKLPRIGWRNSSFHLVESHLGNNGPHYDPIASYELQRD